MNDQLKLKELVNKWIINELTILQKNYFYHLEKKEINLATNQVIKFVKERLSNEYLELIKAFSWDTNTKNTLLFVYQQLLTMLHPAIPFITEYLYQELTQEKILESKIEIVNIEDKNKELWQVDCLLLLISNIRRFQKKNKVNEFYLELTFEWKKKLSKSFDFNYYLEQLTKNKTFILEEQKKDEFNLSLDLQPFGILWYSEQSDKKDLEKKYLEFHEKEYQRSKRLLENKEFIKNAPSWLVKEEEKKLIHHEKQMKNLSNKE